MSDLEEHGHGEIEMRARGVAPAAVIVWQGVVGRAEIGGCHQYGGAARVAPLAVLRRVALHLEAGAAAEPVVKQRRAQCRRVHAVTLAVQISVPTSTA